MYKKKKKNDDDEKEKRKQIHAIEKGLNEE